jgi:hypothetical protein
MDKLELGEAFQAADLKSLRRVIANEIKNKQDHPYFWCLSATVTTEKFVEEFLNAGPPRTAFNPGMLLINLRTASELLDKALGRQGEITSLEERAISTFLDYELSASVQPIQLKLSKLTIKATRKEAVASPGDADESTVVAQDEAQTAARRLRLLLHKSPGHPLNFGERITNLRTLLCDSIVLILDRMKAVRIGMAHFGISFPPEVPNWDGASSRNLLNLVEWLRAAIRSYEAALNVRVEYYRNIFLGADNVITGDAAAVQAELAIDRDRSGSVCLNSNP